VRAKTIIVYGNCQAGIFAGLLDSELATRDGHRVIYRRNFDHPFEEGPELSRKDVSSCSLLFEQHDHDRFPEHNLLPTNCPMITFPSLDSVLFWPFQSMNPYDKLDPPLFPWGHFPYGDRVIVGCIEKGMAPDEILQYYLNEWAAYMPDLNRLFEVEAARLAARDVACQVKIADYFLRHFRQRRLFWTINHPSKEMSAELTRRLLNAGSRFLTALGDIDEEAVQRFGAKHPLDDLAVPIHPRLAEHFKLEWYDAERELHRFWAAPSVSYVEYFRELIRRSLAVKQEKQEAVSSGRM
jgi:polysaccharide biosynthesis acetyltransferase WcbI-like protein